MEPIYKNLGKVRPTIDNNNWSIDNKYDLLTIVYDPSSNKSYISRKDVPANVVIDNREYWLPFGVGRFVDNAIININYLDGVSQELVTYTLEEAIARIGDEDKRLGVIISFYGNEASDSHTPGWCLYQFMSDDLNDWDNVDAWNSIYYNRNKNVGWFRTESELLAIYPSPHKGDYCYIGVSLISSLVYRCYENGTWVNTHELASANIGITIGGNIRISENGTWVVDDEDTGIKAVGTGIERMTYTPSQEDGGTNVLQVRLTDGNQFSFPIKNGNQGNSGIVVPDLETFLAELVNNLTTDDGTKALSAAQGVVLDNKISQLNQCLEYGINIPFELKSGKFYDLDANDTITEVNNAASKYLERIDVSSFIGKYIVIQLSNFSTTTSSRIIAIGDSNNIASRYLTEGNPTKVEGSIAQYRMLIDSPYLFISFRSECILDYIKPLSTDVGKAVEDLYGKINEVREESVQDSDIEIDIISDNIFNSDNLHRDALVGNDGDISSAQDWQYALINVEPGQTITFGRFSLGRSGYYAFYNGEPSLGTLVSVSTFDDPDGGVAATVIVPNGAKYLCIDIVSPATIGGESPLFTANYGTILKPYDEYSEAITKINSVKLAGVESEGTKLSSLVVDLPVSDGTNIESGYAYIDSVNRTVKVKE